MISLRRCRAATRHVARLGQKICDRQKLLIDDNLKRHRFIRLRLDIYLIYEFYGGVFFFAISVTPFDTGFNLILSCFFT